MAYNPTTWVNNVTQADEKTMTNIEKGVADADAKIKRPEGAISPDDPALFSGSDLVRLQAALDFAASGSTRGGTITLARMFDITGGSLRLNKAGPADRTPVTFTGVGGGIKKTDAGPMFTATNIDVGDMTFINVIFTSTVGAGTFAFDSSKIIRNATIGCSYRNVDGVAFALTAGHTYLQSMRFIGDTLVGGSGFAFDFQSAYDCSWDNLLCEGRASGIRQTVAANLTMTGSRIRNCNFEGLTGKAILLGHTYGCVIDGNYFEQNTGGNIEWAATAQMHGLTVSNNRSTGLGGPPTIKWGYVAGSCKSFSNWSENTAVHDTTQVQAGGHITTDADESNNGTPNILGAFDPMVHVSSQLTSTDGTSTLRMTPYNGRFTGLLNAQGGITVLDNNGAIYSFRVTGDGTSIGFYQAAPVPRAAAIASPTSDTVGTKAAIDAIRAALTAIGITL